MGFSRFLKENAGALSSLSERYLPGQFGSVASTAFGAVDAHQQEKAASKALLSAQQAEEAARAGALQGLGSAPRSTSSSLFQESGSFLPKGISPTMLILGGLVLVILVRR